MKAFLLVLCGIAGGVIGGMGLGGGTLLIPLLTMGMHLPAELSAELNLLSFVPMSVVTVILHAKKKMIEGRKAIYLIAFASVGAIAAAVTIKFISAEFLRRGFGWFLISIGSLSFLSDIVAHFRKKKGE